MLGSVKFVEHDEVVSSARNVARPYLVHVCVCARV
jgi:hypothetical protein